MESMPVPVRQPQKRLLFDRRYGWVIDEWEDPSEEALAGGRGMFCILPITKSLVNIASMLMTNMADSAIKTMENPQQFSPKALHSNIMRFAQKQNFKILPLHNESPEQKQ